MWFVAWLIRTHRPLQVRLQPHNVRTSDFLGISCCIFYFLQERILHLFCTFPLSNISRLQLFNWFEKHANENVAENVLKIMSLPNLRLLKSAMATLNKATKKIDKNFKFIFRWWVVWSGRLKRSELNDTTSIDSTVQNISSRHAKNRFHDNCVWIYQ